MRGLLRILLETPGSWLFRRSALAWLSEPTLVSQLPWPYRVFARHRSHPLRAEILFRTIAGLRSTYRKHEAIPVRIGDATVFLDVHDPRCLNVPLELTHGLPQILRHFLRPGDTFIDIGANHGAFSIVAAGLVGEQGLVISIEPQPFLASLIERSLAANHARFQVHTIACGESSGEAPFYIPCASSGSAGLFAAHSATGTHRNIVVQTRRLDDIVDWRRLPGRTFLKIDVEGSEIACLRGACRLIDATIPPVLIEVNPSSLGAAGASSAKLAMTLLELGYDRFAIRGEMSTEQAIGEDLPAGDIVVFHSRGART